MMIQLTLNVLLQVAAVTAGGHDYATAYQRDRRDGPTAGRAGRSRLVPRLPADEERRDSRKWRSNGGLNKVAFAHVNTDQQSDLAGKLMRGGSIPQLVMFHKTDDGWKREQLTGATAPATSRPFWRRPTSTPHGRAAAISSRSSRNSRSPACPRLVP